MPNHPGCLGGAGKVTGPNLARIVKTIRSTRLSGNHMSPSQHHKWEVRSSEHVLTCCRKSLGKFVWVHIDTLADTQQLALGYWHHLVLAVPIWHLDIVDDSRAAA